MLLLVWVVHNLQLNPCMRIVTLQKSDFILNGHHTKCGVFTCICVHRAMVAQQFGLLHAQLERPLLPLLFIATTEGGRPTESL